MRRPQTALPRTAHDHSTGAGEGKWLRWATVEMRNHLGRTQHESMVNADPSLRPDPFVVRGARLEESVHPFRQMLGCDQCVAAQQQFAHFIPIHLAQIQPERDPAPRCDVGGKIKSAGLSLR
jgi:hypothetical protein